MNGQNRAYKPTAEDKKRVRSKLGHFKLSGDGVFASLQGEGITSGEPSVFLRLHYCNLSCGKPKGWKCDTWYTWDKETKEYWQEPCDLEISQVARLINSAWKKSFVKKQHSKRLVVTGGEPLLQQEEIIKLISLIPDWQVEIETNGTIIPNKKLSSCQFNCSPKLSNSGNPKQNRYRPAALKAINKMPNCWFKFVVSQKRDFAEIEEIILNCNINKSKILIMPEGLTAIEVQAHADKIRNVVLEKGWQIAMRNQLIWYGNKRRT